MSIAGKIKFLVIGCAGGVVVASAVYLSSNNPVSALKSGKAESTSAGSKKTTATSESRVSGNRGPATLGPSPKLGAGSLGSTASLGKVASLNAKSAEESADTPEEMVKKLSTMKPSEQIEYVSEQVRNYYEKVSKLLKQED